MKHRFKIEIKVTDTESDRVIEIDTVTNFFHMVETAGTRQHPIVPHLKEPNGRTKTEIVFGDITYKEETV